MTLFNEYLRNIDLNFKNYRGLCGITSRGKLKRKALAFSSIPLPFPKALDTVPPVLGSPATSPPSRHQRILSFG